MSRNDKDAHDTSAIDGVLKNLMNRPNVHSTLVLSRKDGSIIRATGFKDPSNEGVAIPQTFKDDGDEEKKIPEEDGEQRNPVSADTNVRPAAPSSAEVLAVSVYTFMSAAVGLTKSLSTSDGLTESFATSRSNDTTKRPTDIGERVEEPKDLDGDVQLLRMRTKRQEVIIFPDPNYICCVVQNIGRSGGNDNSR